MRLAATLTDALAESHSGRHPDDFRRARLTTYDAHLGQRLEIGRRAEWLVERPWRLAAVVALLVALPLLVLGEVSAAQTRDRSVAAEVEAADRAASTPGRCVADRVNAIQNAVAIAASRPASGRGTPLIDAIERGDAAGMQSSLDTIRPYFDPAVNQLILLDQDLTMNDIVRRVQDK